MTILFQNQWRDYPSAIIDYRTSNTSALNLAAKLRMMGVKNNAFFLALHNPELQGVDPFSSTLTLDQMAAIGIEIKTNAWYFFREIAKAPAQSGIGNNPIEFNRANISLWWSFFCHIFFILVQPRQTGKSFSTDLLMEYLYNFRCNNTNINLMTKDDKLRGIHIKRLKDIYDELPLYLKFKTRDDVNNTEEISIKKFNNTYKSHVPNASPKRAYALGRGITTPIFHIDEPPFQPNIHIAFEAAMGSMGAAIKDAKAKGEPYGVIMTTTAGKKDEVEGAYIYKMVEESALHTEHFFDAENATILEEMVRRHSRGKKKPFRVYAAFSHTQLGKDDIWLAAELERTNATPASANMDFFNRWSSGSQTSPLPQHILETLSKSVADPTYISISKIGGFILRWYIPENDTPTFMATRKCIIGIDSSDASGGDDISLVMTDVLTGKVVAIGNFNENNLITFAEWLVYLLETYLNTTMIIEKRSSGATIIDFLLLYLPMKGIDPFKRLFNWVVNDPYSHPELYKEYQYYMPRRSGNIYDRAKKHFGFATSGAGQSARSELYSTALQNATKRCADGVLDSALTSQITGLITKNGRIDHATGAHDDLVIGWLLCHWFLAMAKNLSNYGIDSRTILSEAVKVKKLTDDENVDETLQYNLRIRIEELFDLLSKENNMYICERYEQEVKRLESKLVLKEGESFSIDAFLTVAKEKRNTGSLNAAWQAKNDYKQRMGYTTEVDRRMLNANTIVL